MYGRIGRWFQAVLGRLRGEFSNEELAAPEILSDYTIENAWRDNFAPVVREMGFKGSGRHFRRLDGEFVQTVNLQGSQYGGKFAVNLGLQPVNIPDVVGREIDPKAIKEIDCVFRNRLTYDGHDTWWSYGEDPKSKQESAVSSAQLFREKALLHFHERMQFAENISPEEIVKNGPGIYVSLALLRERQGQYEQAKQFAKLAMDSGSSKYWKGYSPIKHLLPR
jgi:hypothetical protein